MCGCEWCICVVVYLCGCEVYLCGSVSVCGCEWCICVVVYLCVAVSGVSVW